MPKTEMKIVQTALINTPSKYRGIRPTGNVLLKSELCKQIYIPISKNSAQFFASKINLCDATLLGR